MQKMSKKDQLQFWREKMTTVNEKKMEKGKNEQEQDAIYGWLISPSRWITRRLRFLRGLRLIGRHLIVSTPRFTRLTGCGCPGPTSEPSIQGPSKSRRAVPQSLHREQRMWRWKWKGRRWMPSHWLMILTGTEGRRQKPSSTSKRRDLLTMMSSGGEFEILRQMYQSSKDN